MSEVQRYMMVSHSDKSGGAMIERPNGTWVRYSDYEALAEKYGWTCEAVKVLEKRVRKLEASELPSGGDTGRKTTRNLTKHQHLDASVDVLYGSDNSEQGEGQR